MLAALNILKQEGAIAALEKIDATLEVERARQLDVKSVPWLRIGLFEFEGQMSVGDLRTWAQRAAQPDGLKQYFFEMLTRGQRGRVERIIRDEGLRSIALAGGAHRHRCGVGRITRQRLDRPNDAKAG